MRTIAEARMPIVMRLRMRRNFRLPCSGERCGTGETSGGLGAVEGRARSYWDPTTCSHGAEPWETPQLMGHGCDQGRRRIPGIVLNAFAAWSVFHQRECHE